MINPEEGDERTHIYSQLVGSMCENLGLAVSVCSRLLWV